MMPSSWLTAVDFAICLFILLFLIGQRFDEWPAGSRDLFAGEPSDYIDPFRYYAFYLAYIGTFVVVWVALHNLGLALPGKDLPQIYQQVTQKLGSQSWTVSALFLLALINEKNVEKWDHIWRNRLQGWARIPKAVVELKDDILLREDVLQPFPERMKAIRAKFNTLGVASDWGPVIDHWQAESQKSSLEWHFLKAFYTLRICKELKLPTLTRHDIERLEKRLHDLARVLPRLNHDKEDVGTYRNEVDTLFAHFVEVLCKYVVRKNPSKLTQRDALRNLGFKIGYTDAQEIRIIGVTFKCIFGILITGFVAIALYLFFLDLAGLSIQPNEKSLTWARLGLWTLGNVLSYSMAIFIAVIVEMSSTSPENKPSLIRYAITLFFSVLVSLTFFQVTSRHINWGAHISLALSMGVISIAVTRSLTKPSCASRKEVWVSSLGQAASIGVVAALLQGLAFLFFRGPEALALNSAMILTTLYGFAKGFSVTLLVIFQIQESIRCQLLKAQRKCPRIKLKTSLPAFMDNTPLKVTTRNISKGGLLIEPGISLAPGQTITLNFPFGTIQTEVRWVKEKFAGLAFAEADPNAGHLHYFIREKFGLGFA